MTSKIHILALDRHTHAAELNRLIDLHASVPLTLCIYINSCHEYHKLECCQCRVGSCYEIHTYNMCRHLSDIF